MSYEVVQAACRKTARMRYWVYPLSGLLVVVGPFLGWQVFQHLQAATGLRLCAALIAASFAVLDGILIAGSLEWHLRGLSSAWASVQSLPLPKVVSRVRHDR